MTALRRVVVHLAGASRLRWCLMAGVEVAGRIEKRVDERTERFPFVAVGPNEEALGEFMGPGGLLLADAAVRARWEAGR